MSRNIRSRSAGLPLFCALAPVVWMLSYAIGRQYAGIALGRQSSTFGIAMGLAVMLAPFLAGAGYLTGLALRWLMRKILKRDLSARFAGMLKVSGYAALVVIAVLNWHRGGEPVYAADRAATPRVIQNSLQLHRTGAPRARDAMTPAHRIYDLAGKVNDPLVWGEGRVRVEPVAGGLQVTFETGGPGLLIPAPGIDYVIAIDASPVSLGRDGRTALAILATGQATGRRDLLAIVSPDHSLEYLELLDRNWNLRESPLAIAHTTGGDVILVGSDPDRLLAFSPMRNRAAE